MTGHPGTGTGTSTDPDEDRWAEALSVLEQHPTAAAAQRTRRQRAWVWPVVTALIVQCAAAGALVAQIVLLRRGDAGHVPPWHEDASDALVAVGLLVEVVGLVVLARTELRASLRRSALLALTRRQRRQLTHQVVGQAPADPRRTPLARELAEQLEASRLAVVLYSGIAVMQVGGALDHTSQGWSAFALALVLVFAVCSGLVEQRSRRARCFLEEHPPSAS